MVAINICIWKVQFRNDRLRICLLQLLTMPFTLRRSILQKYRVDKNKIRLQSNNMSIFVERKK